MIKTDILNKKIYSSGLKIEFIANFIGISRQALWGKIKNKTSFKQEEIIKLCDILNIDDEEKNIIFFANDVDK